MSILGQHEDKWVPEPNTGCYIGGGKIEVVAHGPAPNGKPLALHDTPNGCIGALCVNGDHLRWGSRRDNALDEPAERRREWSRRGYEAKTPESRSRMRGARWEAKIAGREFYIPDKLCRRGHDGLYRVANGCQECVKLRNSLRYGK